MQQYLPTIQIVVAVILVVLILLQQRGTALGSAFGQEGGFYATRRGVQQKMLIATIISAVLFVGLALLDLAF